MDEHTEILISLASAAASNCIPCFDHFFQEAMAQKVDLAEIRKALEISSKIKGGAAFFTRKAVDEAMGEPSQDSDPPCCAGNCESSDKSSC